VLATNGDLVENRLRDDAAEWHALAERLDARRVLDISSGLDALPDDGEFDLIVAANDPFAGLHDDAGRASAMAKARRLLAHDGLLVIEGLYVPPQEDAIASGPDGLIRERRTEAGASEREVWRALGDHQYEVRTNDSASRVRAWHCGESALRESAARVAGGLDERDFDPWGDRLIAVVPGWS
jgi:SAM-dependent methyltransferase